MAVNILIPIEYYIAPSKKCCIFVKAWNSQMFFFEVLVALPWLISEPWLFSGGRGWQPSLKLTVRNRWHLKMDGWNTFFPIGDGLFSGAMSC